MTAIIDVATCPVCENGRVLTRDDGDGQGPRLTKHSLQVAPQMIQECPWSGEDPDVVPSMPEWSQ